ncbi:PfkB family carbohydrate kinase [Kribbella sp. NPDC054772]
MSGDSSVPPEVRSLVYDFTLLRKNQGLKQSRLTEERAGNLLGSAAVQTVMSRGGVGDRTEAAVQVVTEAIGKLPSLSDQVIADAILGLGLFLATYAEHAVDHRTIERLEKADLGDRREALRTQWRRLHEAVGADVPETPGDRHLRDTVEPRIFRDVAVLIVGLPADSSPARPVTVTPDGSPQGFKALSGKVVVIGGVAIDHTFHSEGIPMPETSAKATHYERAPGGKGLSQAVAAARLGLDVTLIAACGGDDDGAMILEHLRKAGVDTSLMKVVEGKRSPQTSITELPDGDSAAMVWHNEEEVSLDSQDVRQHREVLADCDAILVTFEIPQDVLYSTLNLIRGLGADRPVIVVTPGQPYDNGAPSAHTFAEVDYLVAHSWELRRLSYAPGRSNSESLAENLLRMGVKSVCILTNRTGTIYSQNARPRYIAPPPSTLKESSIARDLFCAALVARLVEDRSHDDNDAVRWAAAAMASFIEDYLTRRSLPDRDRVEQMLRDFPHNS